jgi:serine phosphatase RsbU (regulator of sigma subunit)
MVSDRAWCRFEQDGRPATDWSHVLAETAVGLAACPPYALVTTLTAVLEEADPDARCEVYLADYRLEELRPVTVGGRSQLGLAGPVRVEGTELGRCFATQRAARSAADPSLGLAPVSLRGDRLGVLAVHAPALLAPDAEDEALAFLDRIGQLLGQALLAADLVTDAFRVARRGTSLTLAAEIQWDRLPGRSLDAGYATIAGQLEPAYSVVGDAYDWVADPDGLSAVLVDGSGYGTHAAGNASFTISAVRNGRREGADLPGMARLADQALHAQHGGAMFASAVLLDLDPAGGRLDLIVAGAGLVLIADRHSARRLRTERHPPLGAEEDYPYRAQRIRVRAGERVVLASDGLIDAQVDEAVFGETLERLVQNYRLLGSAELVRAVIRDFKTFHASRRQQDDAVVLCLDLAR